MFKCIDQRNHNRILHGIEMLIMNISIPQQDIGIRISLPAGITSLQLHYILNYIINSIISFSFFFVSFFFGGRTKNAKKYKKNTSETKAASVYKTEQYKKQKKAGGGEGSYNCMCMQ